MQEAHSAMLPVLVVVMFFFESSNAFGIFLRLLQQTVLDVTNAPNKHPPSVVCSSHRQTYIPEGQDVTTERQSCVGSRPTDALTCVNGKEREFKLHTGEQQEHKEVDRAVVPQVQL